MNESNVLPITKQIENLGQASQDIPSDISRTFLEKSYFMAPAHDIATRLSVDDPEAYQRKRNSNPSSPDSDFLHFVLAQGSASQRSPLCTPLRKGLCFPAGPAQIDVRRPKHEAQILPGVFDSSRKVLAVPLDSYQGSRLAATKRAQVANACARYRERKKKSQIANLKEGVPVREQEVLQKAGQEHASNSPAIENLVDSPAQTDNDGPATNMKLGAGCPDTLTSSTVNLAAVTTSPCTIPCSVSSVVNTDEDELKVSQDPIEPVENVVLGEAKKGSVQSSSEMISTSVLVKRGRGRPRKLPVPTLQPTSKAPKRRSVTGCFTCKRRKKKCDESKPSCESFCFL